MDLHELLKQEEEKEGCKMGYLKACYRSFDWYWKDDFGDNKQQGMIEDLIGDPHFTDEQIQELIEDKSVTDVDSCCDSYFAIAVYKKKLKN